MILASSSLFRVDCPWRFTYAFDCYSHHSLSYIKKMDRGIISQTSRNLVKKQQLVNPVWRPVCSQASSNEGLAERDNRTVSTGKYTRPVQVGASLIRFIRGKWGSTQKAIEEEMGVNIILPSSKSEESIMIQGMSVESVNQASDKIQAIIDEVVKSPCLDYSHFVSLPLAVNHDLVNKLINFQKSTLGLRGSVSNPTLESDSNENTSYDEDKDQLKALDIAAELEVDDSKNPTEIDIKNMPTTSYLPKTSMSPTLSDLGIEKSIFIKPKTFHLTVLMLKLWNKDRVEAATEVLKSVLPKVIDALESRPISVRLKGLSCMRGSLDKARVLYAPVEEIGNENRLLHACQVIINAYVEAGLVLDRDATRSLKLHATVMNARHRKRDKKGRKLDFFDARGIIKQYGSEKWGDYLIQEAHLSQRFAFDENGYYHCCASIPFPQNMQAD